jgi:hypothetical protein
MSEEIKPPGKKNIARTWVRVGLLSLIGFSLTLTTNFTLILCMSKFLENAGSQNIPFYYIALNGLSILAGIFFFIGNFSGLHCLATLCFAATCSFTIFSRFDFALFTPAIYALYISSGLFNIYAFIMFWNVVGKILTIRELKRFIGIIYAINAIGAILPGLFMNFLLSSLSFQTCLLAAGLICCFMGLLSLFGEKWFGTRLQINEKNKKPKNLRVESHILRSELILLTGAFIFFAALIRFFLDYAFVDTVTGLFSSGHELAVFLGFFNSGLRFMQLLSQLLFSRHLLKHLSLTTLIGIVPGIAIPLSIMVIVTDWPVLTICFQFLLMYLLNIVAYPAFNVLLGVVPEKDKPRIRFLGEGILFCFSVLIAGLLILGFQYLKLPVLHLFILSTIIGGIWIFLLFRLRRAYVESLSKLILSSELDDKKTGQSERIQTIQFNSLLNPDERDELSRSLGRLIDEEPQKALEVTLNLLQKTTENDNRTRIVRSFAATGKTRPELNMTIFEFLHENKDFRTFTSFLEALAINGKNDSSAIITKFLNSENNRVRSTVLLYVLRFSKQEDILQETLGLLKKLILSPKAEERSSGAALIGELGLECFLPQLIMLLQDSVITVRKSALIASFKYPQPAILEILEEMRKQKENEALQELLERAITERKDNICQEVEAILGRLDFSRKERVIRTLRRLKNSRTILMAVKLLWLEPFRLSICMVEFLGNYKNSEKLTKTLEKCLKADKLELEEMIIEGLCLPEQEFGSMIMQLASGPESGLFADFLAVSINRLITEQPEKAGSEKTFHFMNSLLVAYGLNAEAVTTFTDIFSSRNEKEMDLSIELIDSEITDSKLKKAFLNYYELIKKA